MGCQRTSDNPSPGGGGGGGTTGSASLAISTSTPTDSSTRISVSDAIEVTFNSNISGSTVTDKTFILKEGTTEITGTRSVSGKTVTLTPTSSLNYNQAYILTITTGLTDTSGNYLSSSQTISFTTTGENSAVKKIIVGDEHTCTLLGSGDIKCWGNNNYGQLGYGDNTKRGDSTDDVGNNLPTVNLGTNRHAIAIAAGARHTCALLDTGTVNCWGDNRLGQLGTGDTTTTNAPASSTIDLGTNRTAVEISAGAEHTCARLDDGTIKCWGSNENGQLGSQADPTVSQSSTPQTVELGSNKGIQLTTGGAHSCVLLHNGKITCWGRNQEGQLGREDAATSIGDQSGDMANLKTVNLSAGQTATFITAGINHTCALLDDHTVKCWGDNRYGQLGKGDPTNAGDAQDTIFNLSAISFDASGDASGGKSLASKIAAGGGQVCVITMDKELRCWGNNDVGQLGIENNDEIGDDSNEMGNNLVATKLKTGELALDVATGKGHSCALLSDGTVKCWGSNGAGQLGLEHSLPVGERSGDMTKSNAVDLGTRAFTVKKVENGANHSCTLFTTGDLKCWGNNEHGQLGLGTTDASADNPQQLSTVDLGGQKILDVGLGENHTCAILSDHTLKCWGYNAYGQLGLDDTTSRGTTTASMGSNLPTVNLGTGRTAVALSLGENHTCALLDNNNVKCWGRNHRGQLGQNNSNSFGTNSGDGSNGTEMASLSSINLGLGRTATKVAAGGDFTCIRLDTGNVRCWGNNNTGQLGQKHAVRDLSPATSTNNDTSYDGLDASDVQILNYDDDQPGFIIREVKGYRTESGVNTLLTSEDGVTATFAIKLKKRPTTGYVYIDASSDNLTEGSVSPTSIIFSSATDATNDYDTEQLVTVTGVDDSNVDGHQNYNIVLTIVDASTDATEYQGLNPDDVAVTNLDDETAGYIISDVSGDTTENGGSATFTVRLIKQPSDTVTLKPKSLNSQEGSVASASQSIVFSDTSSDSNAWNIAQTITITGEDDASSARADGHQNYEIDLIGNGINTNDTDYNNVTINTVTARNLDNEPGFFVSDVSGDTDEHGGIASFTVQLTGLTGAANPASDITIVAKTGNRVAGLISDSTTDGSFGETLNLTFPTATWSDPITVYVQGQNNSESTSDTNFPIIIGTGESLDFGTSKVIDLTAGKNHACALFEDSNISCWGEGLFGKLGYDNEDSWGDQPDHMGSSGRVNLGTNNFAREVHAGSDHTCAILTNGSTKCWGKNERGQLGLGHANNQGITTGEMAQLAAVDLGTINAATISLGEEHSCAKLASGELKCWGSNLNHQLGLDASTDAHKGDDSDEMGSKLSTLSLK